jgi:hypothetical protein
MRKMVTKIIMVYCRKALAREDMNKN